MKTCTACQREKEFNQFYKRYGRPFPKCMDCHRDIMNKRYVVGKHKQREEMNMITINLSDYRLVYFRKTDNRKFLVRRVSAQDYVLYDTVENVKLKRTQYLLRKEFVSDSDNFSRVKPQIELRVC